MGDPILLLEGCGMPRLSKKSASQELLEGLRTGQINLYALVKIKVIRVSLKLSTTIHANEDVHGWIIGWNK